MDTIPFLIGATTALLVIFAVLIVQNLRQVWEFKRVFGFNPNFNDPTQICRLLEHAKYVLEIKQMTPEERQRELHYVLSVAATQYEDFPATFAMSILEHSVD